MAILNSLVAVTALTASILAKPVVSGHDMHDIPASHVLHERHATHWHEHWSKRSRVPADAVLPVRIGLAQSNRQAGHDRLMEM
jgi:tripeptidyl-peptidase I